jgi:hypothetical protein
VPPIDADVAKSNLTFLALVVGNFVLGFLSPSGEATLVADAALPVILPVKLPIKFPELIVNPEAFIVIICVQEPPPTPPLFLQNVNSPDVASRAVNGIIFPRPSVPPHHTEEEEAPLKNVLLLLVP